MKYYYLILLIALLGCREKKPVLIETGAITIKGTKDTLPVLGKLVITEMSNAKFHICRIHIAKTLEHPNSYACYDTSGKWNIYGKCSDIIETMLATNKELSQEIDSLRREIYNIKAKQAEYRYAKRDTVYIYDEKEPERKVEIGLH